MTVKAISILLPDGNPNGVKLIELSNRTIKGYLIPRTRISLSKEIPELGHPTLYFLLDREGQTAYIGECENFFHRIKSHDQNKDFWEIAVMFTAQGLEKSDVKFLESLAVEQAKAAERMTVANITIPARNKLHDFKARTILEFFDDLKLLISTLGYPLFDRIKIEEKTEDDFWYCSSRLTRAKAVYDENGFTVLKGSIIDATEQPSFSKSFPFASKERQQLLSEKATLLPNKNVYELVENITFTSANKAGGFVTGASINAWITWKNAGGKTMDEALRKN